MKMDVKRTQKQSFRISLFFEIGEFEN